MDYSNYSSSANSAGSSIMGLIMTLFWLVVVVGFIVGSWKVFTKAGRPGWASILPFYNMYILLKIVGRPGWWLLLYFIPLVNFVISIIVAIDLAKAFGKSSAYGIILLWIFSFVGYIALGFSNDKYVGGSNADSATPPESAVAPETPVAVG